MKKIEYSNRYGEKFIFTQISKKEILWEGTFEWGRFGFDLNPDEITMVDPSGGPYLAKDMSVSVLDPSWKGEIIGFEKIETGYKILLK